MLLNDLMPDDDRIMGFSMTRIALLGTVLSPLVAAGLLLLSPGCSCWTKPVSAS